MEEPRSAALLEHVGELADPRIDRPKEHQRIDLLVLALCALLWGAKDWEAVETGGKAKREWVTRFLDLAHGIPWHDTFGRVFAVLSPEAGQACVLSWLQAGAPVTAGQGVAIEGKTLRHSYACRSAQAALPLVSAWATHKRSVLGPLKTEENSKELTAIPALLTGLDVRGGRVTSAALGGQKAMAEQRVEQEAESV